jgi:predicted DCC family thiol-disulfide oxidoreductase YuxK
LETKIRAECRFELLPITFWGQAFDPQTTAGPLRYHPRMNAPERPVMVFDGDCGFCRRWIERWRHATGDRVVYVAYQDPGSFPGLVSAGIPNEQFAQAVHFIETDGRVTRGAEAVCRALSLGAGRRWPEWFYQRVPLVAPVSEACYRAVARHRPIADRLTAWLWGRHVVPPGETRTAALFLRLMGVTYAIAFVSLWVQIIGLAGAHGVLPVQEFLEAVKSQVGAVRYWYLPTLCWLNASDGALRAICAAGTLCSLLAIIGFVPVAALAGSWLCYLSLVAAGQEFLQFQWDGLLLEAGFIALLMAPWRWRLNAAANPPPPRAALWLSHWLLFRLMISSAAAKLTSGDPTWRSLTALDFHYFTQPLPPWPAWYAHHWPALFQKLSVLVMFAVEGVVPFFLWGPRRVRFAAVAAIAGLQILIIVTGNYGFFNILTLALCVPFLDDGVWTRSTDVARLASPIGARNGHWPRRVIAMMLLLMSLVPFSHAFRIGSDWLGPVQKAYLLASPLHVVNPYGLFAVMTTDRPEIVIEGSRDRREWQAYEFRYKPGDLARRPAFMAPYMPRLDWQMWFAALGDARQNRWFLFLCWRLLQGSPDVTALLAHDPFSDSPPTYLRAQVYMYEFTTSEERRTIGNWWKRTLRGPYVPELMLDEKGQLAPAPARVSANDR